MFGFVVGFACLFGLARLFRHRHHGGHHGAFGFHRGRGAGPFGFGLRRFLRGLFSRLDTSPGQEKVIVEAVEALRGEAHAARTSLLGARADVAAALRRESFDAELMGELTHRVETAGDALRKASLDAFAKVHAALDERQRDLLARFVEGGRSPFGVAHPYRL